MAINSLMAFTNSFENLTDKLKDGKASTMDFASTIANFGMTAGLVNNLVSKNGVMTGGFGKGLGTVLTAMHLGDKRLLGTSAQLVSNGPGTAGMATSVGGFATVAAILAAIELGDQVISNSLSDTLERKISRTNELAIASSTFAKEEKKKYDIFESTIKEH